MPYKKSYVGFIVWLIIISILCMIPCFLPIEDDDLKLRLVYNIGSLGIAALTWIIYKTGFIYWYNGISYFEALRVGAARRQAYARKHFSRFRFFAMAFLIFSIIAQLLHGSYWIDTVVFTVGILLTAVSTIRIAL